MFQGSYSPCFEDLYEYVDEEHIEVNRGATCTNKDVESD
jgi:hypothetical protein